MFITAGVPAWWWVTAHSMPWTTVENEPDPEHESTRTGTIVAFFATPYVGARDGPGNVGAVAVAIAVTSARVTRSVPA